MSDETDASWLNQFRTPPAKYRPVLFWSWNERIEADELRRQVAIMASAGLGGGFIHSRIGLITPYLGKTWFEGVSAAIDACRKQGLQVWLYDEDKWPSGFSGGSVPLVDERFRPALLFARPVGTKVCPDAVLTGPAAYGIQVYLLRERLGNAWFNGTTYIDTLNSDAVACFLEHAYFPYYQRFAGDFSGTICSIFTDEPAPLSVHSRGPRGAVAFTDGLIAVFQAEHGYDPMPCLPLLFADADGAARFRLHYYRTVSRMFERSFSAQVGQWCAACGVAMTGHYLLEGEMYRQQELGYQVMPNYRHQQWPGIDHLGRQIDECSTAKQCQSVVNQYGKPRMLSELYGVSGHNLSFADRLWIASQQIALGVNLLCEHLGLYTMAGCRKRDFPPNLFYQQPWWPVNHILEDRLGRMCVAMSQGRYAAELLLLQPQESAAAVWRASHAPDRTDNKLDWLYHTQPTDDEVKSRVQAIDDQYQTIVRILLSAQRMFDIGNEMILSDDGHVELDHDGSPALRVSLMRYRAVVLPSMITIARRTFDLLRAFHAAGGMVLRCGHLPHLLDGESSGCLQAWLHDVPVVAADQLPAALDRALPSAIELVGGDAHVRSLIYGHARDLDDGDRLVFLVNLHRTKRWSGSIRLRGGWHGAFHLDVDRGDERVVLNTMRIGDSLTFEADLWPTQNILLRLRRSPSRSISPTASVLRQPQVTRAIDLPRSAWSVERLDDNALPLDYAFWREGSAPWSPRAMPVLAIQQRLNSTRYTNSVTLRYPVQSDHLSPERKLHLVVEHPERYQIRVNGELVAYRGLPAWRDIRWLPIDVTGMLHDGENTIELHCGRFQFGDPGNHNDPFARYGTELEAIYLVGDFSVAGLVTGAHPFQSDWQSRGLPPVHVECIRRNSLRLAEPMALNLSDTIVQGLPFYAGRLRATTRLPENLDLTGNERLMLVLDKLDAAVAEVAVDDQVVDYLDAPPYQVDLTSAITAGRRRLALTLYGTLRNLLGPHHNAAGELHAVGPGSFLPDIQPADWAKYLDRWTRGDVSPQDWDGDYSIVSFGAGLAPSLVKISTL